MKGAPHKPKPAPWTPDNVGNQGDVANNTLLDNFLNQFEPQLHLITRHTNTFGMRWYSAGWEKMDRETTLTFFSILFHMDTSPRPRMRSYWNKGISGDPFVKSSGMSRNRFMKIYNALRVYDPAEHIGKEKHQLWKVKEFLDLCQVQMQKCRLPSIRELSLDEMMTLFDVSDLQFSG